MADKDELQENVRYKNKCLQFKTAEGVSASELLDEHEYATPPENSEDGPVLTKWRGREDELLAEGYPFTVFNWKLNGDLKISDERGAITIEGSKISHASGLHGLS